MEQAALIEGIRRYTIHGEPYAIVFFSHSADRETIHQAQFSEDALPAGLRVGDTVIITLIGSIVAGIRRG
jgi:hypothetical protein